MQSQTTTTTLKTSPVHVKVAYVNEFRRFLLTPVSFDQLATTLKTLFNLQGEFRIKFQDDENDWVLLTTDQELLYATELSGTPLRLSITLLDPTVKTSAENARRGGHGHGCRGRGQGRGGFKSPEERLTAKSSRLANRISQLEEKISSGNLTADRERVIHWRLVKLQEKLAAMKNKAESFANSQPSDEAAPAPEPVSTPVVNDVSAKVEEEEKPSCRGRHGRGRGCGRGGWRRAMMDQDGTDRPVRPRIAPEFIENFRQRKADLRAARESGDAEKIESCLEALKSAKAAKWEARAALRAQASVDEQKL
jgi:hypothetical protein